MRIKERCVFLVYFKLNITGLQHCVSPPPEGSIITESTDLPWMLSYFTSIKVLSSVSAVSGVYCLCLNPIRGKPEKQRSIESLFCWAFLLVLHILFLLLFSHSSWICRLIESSLGSVATKFNFFIHNLAQLRFSGLPANDEPILSFSPKTYTLKQEGRIVHASIFSFQKRYNPDKHYVSPSVLRLSWRFLCLCLNWRITDTCCLSPLQTYVVRIMREGQNEPQFVFRTFDEFQELHNKLTILFPLWKLPRLGQSCDLQPLYELYICCCHFHRIRHFISVLSKLKSGYWPLLSSRTPPLFSAA